nr:MAG TPA: hypothetical protein [Caudoviricetes sp.]
MSGHKLLPKQKSRQPYCYRGVFVDWRQLMCRSENP